MFKEVFSYIQEGTLVCRISDCRNACKINIVRPLYQVSLERVSHHQSLLLQYFIFVQVTTRLYSARLAFVMSESTATGRLIQEALTVRECWRI